MSFPQALKFVLEREGMVYCSHNPIQRNQYEPLYLWLW